MMQKRQTEATRNQIAEEDVFDDPAWEALASGTATAKEVAALQEWAEHSPAAKQAFELFQPVGPKRVERIAEGVREKLKENKLPVIGGKYKLKKVIAQGAMSTVWEAEDLVTGLLVVVKGIIATSDSGELRESYRNRALREGRVLAKLVHPNIGQHIETIVTPKGEPFLVMERLRGRTLLELFKAKRGTLIEPAMAVRIAHGVASALVAVHKERVIHRDIQPHNIFLQYKPGPSEADFEVKLISFNKCKELDWTDPEEDTNSTASGISSYPSPEQIEGRKDIDERTDIWSLGIVLYQMLTGSRPFVGGREEVVRRTVTDSVPKPSSVGQYVTTALDEIVLGCTAKHRNDRIPSAATLQTMLEASALALQPSRLEELEETLRKHRNARNAPLIEPEPGVSQQIAVEDADAAYKAFIKGAPPPNRSLTPYRQPAALEQGPALPDDPSRKLFQATKEPATPVPTQAQAPRLTRNRRVLLVAAISGASLCAAALIFALSLRDHPSFIVAAALLSITLLAGYFFGRSRIADEALTALEQVECHAQSLLATNHHLESKVAALDAEDKKKIAWLDDMDEELNWHKGELERRLRYERKVYKIITIDRTATSNSGLMLKWLNPLTDLGQVQGTTIERLLRTVAVSRNKDSLVESVFEVQEWSDRDVYSHGNQTYACGAHGLLLAVDLGARAEQLVEISYLAQWILAAKGRSPSDPKCISVVLFVKMIDPIAGSSAYVEKYANQLRQWLMETLLHPWVSVNLKVIVGSALHGSSGQLLFAHFVEQLLPRSEYDGRLLERLRAIRPPRSAANQDLQCPLPDAASGTKGDLEQQILQMLTEGHSVLEIAQSLSMSVKAVETYRDRLYVQRGNSAFVADNLPRPPRKNSA